MNKNLFNLWCSVFLMLFSISIFREEHTLWNLTDFVVFQREDPVVFSFFIIAFFIFIYNLILIRKK